MQSEPHIFQSLLPDQSVELITAVDSEREGAIAVIYTLRVGQHTENRYFMINSVSNGYNTVWNFKIQGNIVDICDEIFLCKVPPDEVKHWHITKSASHLKIVCNNETVLNFDFLNYSPGFGNEYQVWSGKHTAVKLAHGYKSTLVLALRPLK